MRIEIESNRNRLAVERVGVDQELSSSRTAQAQCGVLSA